MRWEDKNGCYFFCSQHVESKQVLRCLQRLRLHRYQDASFVRLTDESKALLVAVEPYVIWGYPNVSTVRELILKYGFQSVKNKKLPISSNKQVEDALGEVGIICIEDLVLELFKCGKNFAKANMFLHQFKVCVYG
jgi:large subunit ribosomal protein L7e